MVISQWGLPYREMPTIFMAVVFHWTVSTSHDSQVFWRKQNKMADLVFLDKKCHIWHSFGIQIKLLWIFFRSCRTIVGLQRYILRWDWVVIGQRACFWAQPYFSIPADKKCFLGFWLSSPSLSQECHSTDHISCQNDGPSKGKYPLEH